MKAKWWKVIAARQTIGHIFCTRDSIYSRVGPWLAINESKRNGVVTL